MNLSSSSSLFNESNINRITHQLLNATSVTQVQSIMKQYCTCSTWALLVNAIINTCSSSNCLKFIYTPFHDSLLTNVNCSMQPTPLLIKQAIDCLFYCIYLDHDNNPKIERPFTAFPHSSSLRCFTSLNDYYHCLRREYSSVITIPNLGIIYHMSNVLANCACLFLSESTRSTSSSPRLELTPSFTPSLPNQPNTLFIPVAKGSHLNISSISPFLSYFAQEESNLTDANSIANEESEDNNQEMHSDDNDDNNDNDVDEQDDDYNHEDNTSSPAVNTITKGIKNMFNNN